ncbi:arginine--tRNA ligase [Beggiatoa leptomitoformis]|uniref:Arginine--tRNA ligase n=1 Tax=Beggiatoa leptomitoformis TaxID=288004 RepID=A0A2N9YFJ0_9GAMM|nr:arginine--tRNA ligase [Beggiatoa leptomitoformis]ALG68432.1 arginine--tRNA ligase [Beggiatoa leptomitoformis]AUI69237.1 arginine--tRNA ligase [Beggiatoa leptomitoformis]
MKVQLQQLINEALQTLQATGVIPADTTLPTPQIERTRDPLHGDFASNIALMLAKPLKSRPRDIATQLLAVLPHVEWIEKIEIAGAGFINVFLAKNAYLNVVKTILTTKSQYGYSQLGAGKSVMVEFVSANPTGPLHVGHGRGAAYGAALSTLLTTAGYNVTREYYVNDAGRQMDILGTSVWLRYLELCGEAFTFPSNGYKGKYIYDIANELYRYHQNAYHRPAAAVFADIPADEPQGGDKEIHIDALVERAKTLLGATDYRVVFKRGLETILADIRADLEEFGVNYDHWFSEYSLVEDGTVQRGIEKLIANGYTYEKEGALWFRSSDFGDEKDRVLVRDNGQATYFASDVAYHFNKVERGFQQIINVWGADHHGYIPRVKAAMSALGLNPDCLTVLLVQFATLYRGTERVQMSTRSGEFVTLRELREEVGKDAARFFYIQRKSEQHLDFDLELAKSNSNENPVYYIQYAHARICSVFRQLQEKNLTWSLEQADLNCLDTSHEQTLLTTLSRYPEMVESAARNYEPHQITYYLREVAQDFHAYYNTYIFIVDDEALRNARLSLIKAVQQVLQNGLAIIGVSAPEVM